MQYKPLVFILSILLLTSLACGVTINLPVSDVKTGPTVTEEIVVPENESTEPVDLTIEFGAGELNIQPGAENALVTGTVSYNIVDFKPDVLVEGNQVTLKTGNLEIKGIPIINTGDFKNEWDLQLGNSPMNLSVSAGAYNGNIELGGLSLLSVRFTDGAAEVDVQFSELNQVEMDTLRYDTGASSVELRGLANTNAANVIFKGGAGEYRLDFSGDLQRDMDVTVDSGMSNVEIIVPRGVTARVLYDGGLSNVDLSGDWEKSGDDYYQEGTGPRLTINVNIGAGNLSLSNR
jgi:hypothetical protein